jgi:branched-chain amino acid transport system substrate-binding protein
LRRLALVLAVSFLVLATPVRAADPLTIDVVLSLTGGAAFLGKAEQKTFDIAAGVINARGGVNGRDVRFAYADDTSNPQVAVQLVNGIIARSSPIILGSGLAAVCNAIDGLLAQKGPVNYCLSPVIHPAPGSYVFSAGASSVDDVLVLTRYFRERGWTRVAVITATDATGQDMDAAFNAVFPLPANKSLQIVAREHFNPGDISVSAQLARIKAANPQVLLTWTIGTPFGTLLRGIKDAGLDLPVLAGNGNMLYSEMAQFRDILPREMYFVGYRAQTEGDVRPGPIRDAQQTYFKAFKAAGVRPDIAAVTAWDPIFITIDAVKNTGPDPTAEKVRAAIAGLHGWAGVNALYDFRDGSQRGIGASALVMDRWDVAKDDWVVVSKPGGALK